MIEIKTISEDQARKAIETGDFDESVKKAGERVAIILTQDWCPQWLALNRWLGKAEKKPTTDEPDVVVYELIYNGKPYGNEFMQFKEDVLGNDLVPYVRYYRSGEFVRESNYVSRDRFFANLES